VAQLVQFAFPMTCDLGHRLNGIDISEVPEALVGNSSLWTAPQCERCGPSPYEYPSEKRCQSVSTLMSRSQAIAIACHITAPNLQEGYGRVRFAHEILGGSRSLRARGLSRRSVKPPLLVSAFLL